MRIPLLATAASLLITAGLVGSLGAVPASEDGGLDHGPCEGDVDTDCEHTHDGVVFHCTLYANLGPNHIPGTNCVHAP